MLDLLYVTVTAVGFYCAPVQKQVSHPGLTWTPKDDKIIKVAQKGCQKTFGKDSCLTVLRKTGEQSYQAKCAPSKLVIEPNQ